MCLEVMFHSQLQCLDCISYFTPHAPLRPGGGESRIPFAKELFLLTRGTVDQNPAETASCRGIFNYCRWSGWRNIAVTLRDQKIKLQSMYASSTQLCSPAQLCRACCAKVQGRGGTAAPFCHMSLWQESTLSGTGGSLVHHDDESPEDKRKHTPNLVC